ncbi:hypothetical protein SEPCBS119000_004187 [Sporothrix epigloea]|uniref:GCN5-related N-acetyltransferase Rv2170-like domain-containing protein n=1 Tax=Sporothrix epigloea TaxID=1892477 RepID=A0ABP0DUH9_9PEZI
MYVEDTPQRASQAQLALLRAHLPYSLPVLRRMQVAAGAFDGIHPAGKTGTGTSPYAHVLFAYDCDGPPSLLGGHHVPFAAVFLELDRAPETAAWVYASDQDQGVSPARPEDLYPADNDRPDQWVVDRGAQLVAGWSPERRARCRRLVLALLRRARALARTVASELAARQPARFGTPTGAAALVSTVKANLHDGIRYVLQHPGPSEQDGDRTAVLLVYHDAYDKWLFRVEDVPVLSQPEAVEHPTGLLGTGGQGQPALLWDRVRTHDDAALVISCTAIPRTVDTLLSVPSVALREKSTSPGEPGALQAWAFVGIDGSLWTLHTQPAYRGRGLAKTLAARLFRQYCRLFDGIMDDDRHNDGWCAADVSASNRQSQGVCKRLGARRAWSTAWIVITYDSLGDQE